MSQDKPGFFGRLFGRRGAVEAEPSKPEIKPDEQASPAPDAAEPAAPEPADQAPAAPETIEAPLAEPEPIAPEPVEPEPEPVAALAEPEVVEPAPAEPEPPAPIVPEAEAPKPAPKPEPEPKPAPKRKLSWWQRLKGGLARTASALSNGISDLFTKRKLDADTLEDLEDLLIQADLGIDTAARIAGALRKERYERDISAEEVKAVLAAEIEAVLEPVAKPLEIDADKKPFVLLMVGVNGSGKTTTIGKLSSKFTAEGRKVVLAAGDTFRAAAIEQLKVWGARTKVTVVSGAQGADAAGLAFDALTKAKAEGADILMVDTAGRLQNKTELMAELEKVIRVIKKQDETAPHAVLLVLDATVGQNAISQVEAFQKTAGVTGLVMTKLDGTARGGILVALAAKFGLPIHFIGVGEGVDDLEPFAARDFARALVGLEDDKA
jgi:fused signal recognition particle receptor